MRAHRALDDREHAVRGDPHEVRPRAQSSTICSTVTIDAPAGRERAPHPFEQRRVHATLPCRSATGACISATSGTSGASSPTSPNGVSTRVYASFSSIDEPAIERVDDRGQPARGGFEPLRERKERPVLDLDLAALVRAARTTGSG